MDRAGSNKLIGVALIVIALGSYFFGFGSFFGGRGMIPLVALVAGIFFLFQKDKPSSQSAKTYKQAAPQGSMKMHYLFYVVGVIFIFASVWYFTREFIRELPDMIKLILLIISVVVSFVVAEFMRGADI